MQNGERTIEITEISRQKKKENRYNLYCEDGFLLSLSDETIVKNGIKKGSTLTREVLDALRAEDTVKYAKELSLNYISYSKRTQKEVLNYLEKKGIDEASANEALLMLKEYRYIDDEEYARLFFSEYIKKTGPAVIRQKLMLKGISPDICRKIAQESEDDGLSCAKSVAEKYSKKYSGEPEPKKRQKIYAALLRKGFSYDVISKVINTEEDY